MTRKGLDFDHPFPNDLVRDMAATEYAIEIEDLHRALEAIHTGFDDVRDRVERKATLGEPNYEHLGDRGDVSLYAVPRREWTEILESLRRPSFVDFVPDPSIGVAARRVHDAFVESAASRALGERYGLVLKKR